ERERSVPASSLTGTRLRQTDRMRRRRISASRAGKWKLRPLWACRRDHLDGCYLHIVIGLRGILHFLPFLLGGGSAGYFDLVSYVRRQFGRGRNDSHGLWALFKVGEHVGIGRRASLQAPGHAVLFRG